MQPSLTTDRVGLLFGAFAFSLALGAGTITIPLVALEAGYDAPAIGFLAATAAAVQLGTRVALPIVLGRFPDRVLIGVSGAMMAAAFGLLVLSTALPVFALAQVLQGAARALFWTSSQTHAVRAGTGPVRRLVDLTVTGNAGTLSGPLVAGWLGGADLAFALVAGAVAAGTVAIVSPLLDRQPPFDRARGAGTLALLRRDGVALAGWAAAMGGGWWSMVGSYVPVLLVGAGLGPGAIGVAVTASEGAGFLALLGLRSVPPTRVRRLVLAGTLGTGLAVLGLAVVPPVAVAYGLLLVVGGGSSGATTALAPALASLAAGSEEQGDALALSGTFRAVTLFASPAAVGALLAVIPLSGALALLSGALAAPGLVVTRRGRRSEADPDG